MSSLDGPEAGDTCPDPAPSRTEGAIRPEAAATDSAQAAAARTEAARTEAASPLSPLALLLDVQSLDLTAEQLSYRRRELPERAQLAALDRNSASLRARFSEAQSRRDELGANQERLDRQVDMLTSRMAAIESRLSSGAAGSFRDQEAMANESTSLDRQRRALEDQELEIMEALEPVDAELAVLQGQISSDDEARAAVGSALAASEAAIDEELAAVLSERNALAGGLPADLSTIYERLRAKLGGVGAARLVDGACSGCHLKLPARERDLIQHAPDDTVFYCEQCGRILVP